MKVGIVGGGNAGTLFLKSLLEIPEVTVIGICDKNPEAAGLVFARQHNIPTFSSLRELMNEDLDVVLELTGNPAVSNEIYSLKRDNMHIIDSQAAKLTSLLTEHQQKLSSKLASYINHIKEVLVNATSNISAINETVSSLENTSKKIFSSVSSFTENVSKTDDIIKIINDITAKIKILGINASIEAAQAGEYGKGFSVVATEINRLTESSKSATSKILPIIESMKTDIEHLKNIIKTLDTVCQKQSDVARSLEEDNVKMSSIIENN